MYNLNRTVFVICYIAITMFGILLSLKQAPIMAPSFFFGMMAITVIVDRKITKKFVQPSITLALTNARIIDEDNKRKEERHRRYEEYRAAKLEKKRQASKEAKAEKEQNWTPINNPKGRDKGVAHQTVPPACDTNLLPSLHASDSQQGGAPDSAPKRKPIQFQVFKEESEEQLRQRRAARLAAARGNKIASAGDEENGVGGDNESYDFFLYRQPQLNKFLWETKPRPYR